MARMGAPFRGEKINRVGNSHRRLSGRREPVSAELHPICGPAGCPPKVAGRVGLGLRPGPWAGREIPDPRWPGRGVRFHSWPTISFRS